MSGLLRGGGLDRIDLYLLPDDFAPVEVVSETGATVAVSIDPAMLANGRSVNARRPAEG